jgi:hypothetical protein
MTLAWDRGDRIWLARILAAVAVANLVSVAIGFWEPAVVPPHPGAPAWLLALADTPWATAIIATIGIVAALASARKHPGIATTIVWLAASALLVEAAAARGPGPYRGWFFVGAAGIGAVIGRAWARLGDRRELESAATELGVLATLAACYVGAASSKLLGSGASWADATTLRAVALAHAHVDDPGLAQWLADAPHAASVLSWATVVIQLSAIGLVLGPVPRMLAVIGLVAFHLGVAAFARIGYWSPVMLLLVFGLPWPRWIARLRTSDPDPAWTITPRADRITLAILAVAVALAWLVPIRDYAAGHHRPRTLDDAGASPSRTPIDTFGPLSVGLALGHDWHIDAIERERSRAMIVIAHPMHGRAVLWVSAKDPTDHHGSPFDRGTIAIAYEGSDARRFTPAAQRVADLLAAEPAPMQTLQ